MNNDTPILEASGIGKHYADNLDETAILQQLDFCLRAGETVAIVGASGAGKSTLLHVLGGLDRPDQGEVRWNGRAIGGWSERKLGLARNHQLGFVYQFHHLLPEFSALDNVAMPLRIRGLRTAEARARARELLTRTGLQHRLDHLPSQLSGGERQRVAISRGLVTQPRALLADEPTGNLDSHTADIVFNEMLRLNRDAGVALLLVTHSMELAGRCQRLLRLSEGKLFDDR
ncbi:MAG: ABC transporter ATP-binding protein [Burkholderiaceae bacterium]